MRKNSAAALYAYICDTYGSAIISGQQESTWMGGDQYEFEYIHERTGKYPAIRGLDYMENDFEGVNKRAAAWHERGGIVTICWHCGSDFNGGWSESEETEISDWDKALTEGTAEYEALVKGMDKAAKALKKLQEQDIPVLWRPFHEFDGAWFWWGKGGPENFKRLWVIMHDRYTNYHKLDNLIWVLGYSGVGKGYEKWYPGDDYVDVIGADSYTDGANENLYELVKKIEKKEMPICFHECGRIPTVEQLRDGKAGWVWFMAWHTEYLTDTNDDADLKRIYNDAYVITLDKLPASMPYRFYGWECAVVPALTKEYAGIETPQRLYDALSEIWCEYTCAPRLRKEWSKENKTLGQCSITAFLVQDIFGGKVYGVPREGGTFHCYNVVGESVFDLTSEQFGEEKLCYQDNPEQFREVHFAKEEKRKRYEYLRDALRRRCGDCDCNL